MGSTAGLTGLDSAHPCFRICGFRACGIQRILGPIDGLGSLTYDLFPNQRVGTPAGPFGSLVALGAGSLILVFSVNSKGFMGGASGLKGLRPKGLGACVVCLNPTHSLLNLM